MSDATVGVGRIALVTVANKGIGKEIALSYGREGALVVVHYGSNESAAKEVVDQIQKEGGRSFSLKADLSSLSQIDDLFSTLDEALKNATGSPQFDILVNNAGVVLQAPLEATSEEAFD